MSDRLYAASLSILFAVVLTIAWRGGHIAIRGGSVEQARQPILFYAAVCVSALAFVLCLAIALGLF